MSNKPKSYRQEEKKKPVYGQKKEGKGLLVKVVVVGLAVVMAIMFSVPAIMFS